MALTRDLIRSGWIQSMVATSGLPIKALTEEELQRSRAAALARHPQGEDLALFAYGSLIWNPAFHFVRREVAAVRGLHRRFCLWTQLGRGSPDNPGLVLGLDRGGSCRGVVYWIAAEEIEGELDVVWRREMVTGAYRPTWVTARTVGGPPVPAITFAINREHERYDLFNTTVHLDELGITDPALHRLCRAVRERQRELSLPGAPHSRASDAAGGAGAA
jgi:cation transport protein ChaC